MAEPKLRRRGHGEDAIYSVAAKNRYCAQVAAATDSAIATA
jgi:hypothetical protein